MNIIRKQALLAAVLTGVLTITSAYAEDAAPGAPKSLPGGLLKGYLPREALPNSLVLLPPPPPAGSAAFALDEDVARKSVALRGTPRWTQAEVDADLSFPKAAAIFSCALKAPITEERTPHLYVLLRRSLTDVGLSTYAAKDHYHRTRPFMENKEPICTPAQQADIEKDGSYPSGHAAVGWGWALILSEIAPEQTDSILARGAAYGDSRSVCNVHWHSDIVEGQAMAAGVVARLHAEPAFRADLEAAKSELAAIRADNVTPASDCAEEAAALTPPESVDTTLTARAQTDIPKSTITPDSVETRVGTLDFKDGMPSKATLDKVYENLDFVHAFDAFMNTYQGVNIFDMRKGLLEAGVKDNEIIIFSELMDAKSLYLTANSDTIYFHGFIDLSKGPMVFEAPPGSLGLIDDMWFRWVIDFGGPGPDRGEGGKYLILPPGYDGPVPEGGFYVARSKTNHVLAFGRSFMQNSDPKPVVDLIRRTAKIYPYTPGGAGTSIAEFLTGNGTLAAAPQLAPQVFHEGTGKSIDTIPPSDFSYYELLNELVQQEPATSLDAELMGPIAAIGIVKGKPFAPNTRMKKTLSDAVALANATARSLAMNPRDPGAYYYPGKSWFNPLFVGGADFETPAAQITPEGAKPYPRTGYRTLDARTSFFYFATGNTPAMVMNLTGIGSQYLMVTADANKDYFDGSKAYRVTLPKGIPQERFWSFTVYDNQTRSFLDTPQRYPRAGDQSYPSPAAEPDADGSTTVYFSPTQPTAVKRGNWIQTDPKRGWFTILRLYSPTQAFFDKTWQPSEVELVK